MNNRIKASYIFGALMGVMVLTMTLSFFMNTQFIQSQLRTNLYQEIEYTRDLYKLKLLNLVEVEEEDDLSVLFQGDLRSSPIQVILYNDYGHYIGGNILRQDEGINPIKTMMLNGLEDTLYEGNRLYSFTSVTSNEEDVYLMLEMSDQRYREGIRHYYFRTVLVFVLVSAFILLIGYKLIDYQKSHS